MSGEENTYTGSRTPTSWYIEGIKREASTGVVREVEWYLIKTHEQFSVNRKGVVELTGSSSDPNFIPFDDLTQHTVLGWITGSLDIASIYSDLSSTFNAVLTQSAVAQTPW